LPHCTKDFLWCLTTRRAENHQSNKVEAPITTTLIWEF
jgi:hypothetical protein